MLNCFFLINYSLMVIYLLTTSSLTSLTFVIVILEYIFFSE